MDVSFLSQNWPWSKSKTKESEFVSDLNYNHSFSPDHFFVRISNRRQTLLNIPNDYQGCFDVIAPEEDSAGKRLLQDIGLLDNGMRNIFLTDFNSAKTTPAQQTFQIVKKDNKTRDPLRCIAINKGVVNVPRVLKLSPLRYEKEFLLSLRNHIHCRIPPDGFPPIEIQEHPKKIKKEICEKKSQNKEKKNSQKLKKKSAAADISFPSRKLSVPLLTLSYLSLLDENDEIFETGEENSEELNAGLQTKQESRARRLETRQRQIDIGKNTPGYKNYIDTIPKDKRKKGDPQTPNKYQVCSKRSWDGQIRKWRRMLHKFDPPEVERDKQKETITP